MSTKLNIHRRDAMKLTALGLAAAMSAPAAPPKWPVKPSSDPFGGLKVGLTSYTTRKLSLDETIAALKRLDIRYISIKSMHWQLESTKAEREAVGRKSADAGLTLMGCGVLKLENDEKQIRETLDYCRDVGSPMAVAAPKRDALGAIDRVIKDYGDLKVAIHNHGPEDGNFPSPTGVFKLIQGLDERIGCCVDVGHTFRLAEDPVEALKTVRSRLFDIHLKDVSATGEKPPKVPVGRGVLDHPAILRTLADLRFAGHVALEWEAEAEDPLPGMAESYGYVRGVFGAA